MQPWPAGGGLARLAKADKSTEWRVLDEWNMKPNKFCYYLQKRDPAFDSKLGLAYAMSPALSRYSRGKRDGAQAKQPKQTFTQVNLALKLGSILRKNHPQQPFQADRIASNSGPC